MVTMSTGFEDADDPNPPICNVVTVEPESWNGQTMVMTHGAWHNGTHYLETFDGRPGWAHDFAAAGYRVLVVDYPGTGASPEVANPEDITAAYICRGIGRVIHSVGTSVDLLVHSMSGPYGITLMQSHGHLINHLVAVAPASPPPLATPPTAVDDLGDSVRVVYGTDERVLPKHGWTEGDLAFVKHCIGPGSRFPAMDLDVYVASLSPLWAGLSIDWARMLLDPPAGTIAFAGSRIMVISGTHDLNHPRATDQKLADWLVEHGAKAEYKHLGDLGIEGNGHMMMLEDNSSELAGVIVEWLATH